VRAIAVRNRRYHRVADYTADAPERMACDRPIADGTFTSISHCARCAWLCVRPDSSRPSPVRCIEGGQWVLIALLPLVWWYLNQQGPPYFSSIVIAGCVCWRILIGFVQRRWISAYSILPESPAACRPATLCAASELYSRKRRGVTPEFEHA